MLEPWTLLIGSHAVAASLALVVGPFQILRRVRGEKSDPETGKGRADRRSTGNATDTCFDRAPLVTARASGGTNAVVKNVMVSSRSPAPVLAICQVKRDTSVQFIWVGSSGWLIQAWVVMAGGWGPRPNRAGLAW